VRRFPIRLKLTAALVVPLVGLLLVTWFEVRGVSHDVEDIKAQAELAEASLGPSSLLTALQQERASASVHMIGLESEFALEMGDTDARSAMDRAIERTRRWLDDDHEGTLSQAYSPSLDELSALDDIRARVDAVPDTARNIGNAVEAGEVFDQYSVLMATLFDANREISFAIEDNGLRRGVDLYSLTAQQTNTLALLVRDLTIPAALQQRLDQPELVAPVARDLAQLRAGEAAIRTKSQGTYAPLAEKLLTTDHIVALPQLAQQALDTGSAPITAVVENSLGTDAETFGYLVFRNAITDEITERAAEAKAAADARLQRYLVLGLLATVLAGAATWLVSRSITRPLRSLDRQARDLAVDRLPMSVRDILETPLGEDVQVPTAQPIVVRSRDEVGDVVNALNTVQESALDLAIEQAVLRRNLADSFVNLGRRNQNLLSRQLDFITVLEASEVEPDVLASLFRLDHLATRMRRNAESLLVLAGIDPPRKWSAPLRLNDIVRAALGEVEDYHRVIVQDFGAVTVMGSVGADLAHLIAELVENALTFSPPAAPVEVRGRPRPDGGFAVAVIDVGQGMADHEVAAANRRLAGQESFTVAPSKYLGHYVAGHLAARHDIGLRLEARPGEGITAVIELPGALFVAAGAPELPARLAPAGEAPRPPAAALGAAGGAGPGRDGPGDGPGTGPGGLAVTAPPAEVRPLPQDAPAPLPRRSPGADRDRLPPVHPEAPWGAQVPGREVPPPPRPTPTPIPAPAPRPAHLAVGTPRREARRQARYGPPGDSRPPLTRRRPGAQAVATDVARLGRSDGDQNTDDRATRSPEAVHSLLSNFAAGVRQGQAHARRRRPPDA
jgi:signal transduction histidine kinase